MYLVVRELDKRLPLPSIVDIVLGRARGIELKFPNLLDSTQVALLCAIHAGFKLGNTEATAA